MLEIVKNNTAMESTLPQGSMSDAEFQEVMVDAAIAHLDRIAALHRRTLLCRRLVQFPGSRRNTQ